MEVIVNNIKIHYETIGSGKPIILLNPNSVNTNAMKFIAKKLSNDFKVYLFDRRCCGKSEKNCKLTYEESAKDVYLFIKSLNLNKPYLLGCSGGGIVALNVAIKYPDCISKLICCSAVARMSMVKKPSYIKIIEKLPFYPGKKENEMFEHLNQNTKDLKKEDLNKITVQTLIVNGGSKDLVLTSEAKYIKDNIRDSKLLILEKETHFSYMINCKWYDKLKEFLNT